MIYSEKLQRHIHVPHSESLINSGLDNIFPFVEFQAAFDALPPNSSPREIRLLAIQGDLNATLLCEIAKDPNSPLCEDAKWWVNDE